MTETALDAARRAMAAAPQDDAARRRFYTRLAATNLAVLLEREPDGDGIEPALFDVDGTSYVLAFEGEGRLADFAAAPAPYVALSGRALVEMLAAERIGLALNLDRAETAFLMPAEAVAWLAGSVPRRDAATSGKIAEIAPPGDLPRTLLEALDTTLSSMAGLAQAAVLAEAVHRDGSRRPLLAILGAAPGEEPAIALALADAAAAGWAEDLDIAFPDPADPALPSLLRQGLRIDLGRPRTPAPAAPPGGDPDRPPKLR